MDKYKSNHLEKEGGMFMRPLFDKLNKANVRYCVLRNYTELPDSTGGSDVDMWVHKDDLLLCEKILKDISCETHMPLVSYYDAPVQYKVCYMGVSDGVQFDIFKGDIYWTNRVMFSGESIQANTILLNGVKVLSEAFADLQTVVKELIYTKDCRQKYVEKIYQSDIYTEEYLTKYLDRFDKTFILELEKNIRERKIDDRLKALGDLAQRSLSTRDAVSKLKYKLSKFKRIWKQPGYVICVEGTDGSGKSFIINAIEPMLNGAFHNHISYSHLRPQLIPDIAVLFGKRSRKEKVDITPDPHAHRPSGFGMSMVRLVYYILDYSIGYLVKVFPLKLTRTHVFIFDRYFYDYYVDQRRARIKLPLWIVRCFETFVPRPDIILCLGGDPETIYKRKPETSLEEVKRQTEVMRKFSQSRENAFWIDTTLEPEESIELTMNAILSIMGKRFAGISYM